MITNASSLVRTATAPTLPQSKPNHPSLPRSPTSPTDDPTPSPVHTPRPLAIDLSSHDPHTQRRRPGLITATRSVSIDRREVPPDHHCTGPPPVHLRRGTGHANPRPGEPCPR